MQCAGKKEDDKADSEKGQVGVLVSLQMDLVNYGDALPED